MLHRHFQYNKVIKHVIIIVFKVFLVLENLCNGGTTSTERQLALNKVFFCRHLADSPSDVLLRRDIISEAVRCDAEDGEGWLIGAFCLSCFCVNKCEFLQDGITMLAVPFFIGPITEVHDKVAVADAETSGDTEQVEVSILESYSLITGMKDVNFLICDDENTLFLHEEEPVGLDLRAGNQFLVT